MHQIELDDRTTVLVGTRSPLGRWLCSAMLAAILIMYIVLTAWNVGSVPIRGVLVGGCLTILVLLYPGEARRAVERHSQIFVLAAVLALLGIFVSLANGTGLDVIVMSVLEVHVQILLTLVFATIVAEVVGARASARIIVACVGLTAFFAVLQFAGVDSAWSARELLGKFQGEPMDEIKAFIHGRPMGLSFSPIQLSTQLCLAFAVYAAVAEKERIARLGPRAGADPHVFAAVGMLLAVSIAGATRSPILGATIFLVVYTLARRQGAWLAVLLVLGGAFMWIAGGALFDTIQSAQPRITQVSDDSAMGRFVLWKYGLMLFRDNPLGYGFGFVPANQRWPIYWHDLYMMQAADDIKTKELHNYVLNMVNTYGIGLVLVMPLVVSLLRRAGSYLIYFIPYAAHILFHNAGPFWNDTLIWFVVGAISAIAPATSATEERPYSGKIVLCRTTPWYRSGGVQSR